MSKATNMTVRKIVEIDESKCDGCGLCVPECVEGAIKIIDGKAKLVSETYCDGLGACLGHCPQDAIKVIEREAEEFDEEAVEKHMAEQESEHVEKLVSAQDAEKTHQCPGSMSRTVEPASTTESQKESVGSALTNWPIQIKLAPPVAPYFEDADLLIAADCVPFAVAGFHQFLQGKVLLIGCPKLDEADFYTNKLGQIIKDNNIKSVTVAHMEVPCCFGLDALVKQAVNTSGKDLEVKTAIFGVNGEKID